MKKFKIAAITISALFAFTSLPVFADSAIDDAHAPTSLSDAPSASVTATSEQTTLHDAAVSTDAAADAGTDSAVSVTDTDSAVSETADDDVDDVTATDCAADETAVVNADDETADDGSYDETADDGSYDETAYDNAEFGIGHMGMNHNLTVYELDVLPEQISDILVINSDMVFEAGTTSTAEVVNYIYCDPTQKYYVAYTMTDLDMDNEGTYGLNITISIPCEYAKDLIGAEIPKEADCVNLNVVVPVSVI